MQIKEITREQFDEFARKHPYRNLYQTSQYGTLMGRHDFTDNYIGLLNDNNQMIAASLILTKKLFDNYKYGYAPRGFLIDFHNTQLLINFTKYLKIYLKKLKYVYLKIDPYIINIERDKKGDAVAKGINNGEIINNLKKLGYTHGGFNLNFENLKPRWDVITPLDPNLAYVFNTFSKETKNSIRKAHKRGVITFKGTKDDVKLFYTFVGKKHTRQLKYYLDYYEIFNKNNMMDIYFAKLSIERYLKNSAELYEYELKRNGDLAMAMQHNLNNPTFINQKIESDKLLNGYKNDVIASNKMARLYPDDVILGAIGIIKYNEELFVLIDGFNEKFKAFCPNYLLKWKIIEEYAPQGYTKMNLNGISGNFNKDSKLYGLYKSKIGFNGQIKEYIGEFDLIINKNIHYIYSNIKPIHNFIIGNKGK